MLYLLSVLSFASLTTSLAAMLMVSEYLLISYGVCKIDINAGEKSLAVEGGRMLLESLYENEIFIPSACGGKGTCGHCKVSVIAGGGPVLPTETSMLTRREIRSGIRLACQLKIREDIYLRVPQELLNVMMFASRVQTTVNLTRDIKQIRLSLVDPPEISHRPGQYVQVQAPSQDGPVFRAYSISSPVYKPDAVELVVKLVQGGIASTYLHNLAPGDTVSFTGPYGDFRLNEDPSVEIVCVGGGCGMAPMKNIIYTLYEQWPDRVCWLFFGCRTRSDVFYLERFEKLAQEHPSFHVVYALSEELDEDNQWDGERGFIHLSVDKYLEPDVGRQAFLCGPELMIEAVKRVLNEKGTKSENIFYDKF